MLTFGEMLRVILLFPLLSGFLSCNAARGENGAVVLRKIVSGFQKPLQVVFPPERSDVMYVVEQGGKVYRIEAQKRSLFLDLSKVINSGGGEEGLLSMAFSPAYREGRVTGEAPVYVNYTAGRPSFTHIAEIPVDHRSGQPPRARENARRILLKFRQPYRNHNGGLVMFGPDGRLYIGTGDGGSAGDPLNAGQDPATYLGKILRIDPRPGRTKGYSVPPDNPLLTRKGFLPETYAYGLRNPWRFSFDRENGRLYAGDVGQNEYEEIDLIRGGDNLGWRLKEGSHCYEPQDNCDRPGLTDPIHEYAHDEGQSVTGGFVYRGKQLAGRYGQYFFADFVSGKVWALPLNESGRAGGAVEVIQNGGGNWASFGEDAAGELYLVDYGTGSILKLGPGH